MSQSTINDDNRDRNSHNNSGGDVTSLSVNHGDEFTLDSILVRIGQFGRFQLIVFLLICMPMLFNAIFSVTYIFTASTVVHRCNITECDTPTSVYDEPWTAFSIPRVDDDLDNCNRYVNKFAENNTNIEPPRDQCFAEYFDAEKTEQCDTNNLIYRDDEVTISNSFGIYCDEEWKLALVGTINSVGQFIGIPLGGFISDRFGRRTSVALGGFLSAIFGIIRSFSPSYIFFMVFEFLDNLANSTLYSTCFIVGIELVGPKRRVIACSVITIFYAVGEILLAVVAKYYPDWRVFLRILYVPALLHLALFWVLPESVRWLLSQGKEERAKKTLRRAAAVNKRRLSEHSLEKLVLANREKMLADTGNKFPIKEAFSKLFWRIANCCLCWIVNAFVYYGLSLNAVLLDGDKYVNFMYIALVEIPGFLLPYVTMDWMGRRYSLFMYMIVSGICCLCTIFVSSSQVTLTLILFLIGKLAITASFQVVYFFTSEIFPTNIRNSLLSFCSMIGRFGSMLAPLTPLLVKYNKNLPSMLFAGAAILSGCLCLLFPETTNLVLPSTMQEADSIGVKKKPPETQSEIFTINTSSQL